MRILRERIPLLAQSASRNRCEKWLQAFADKLECGCVRAKSAIDVPMLSFTGVARNAWMSPAWGPVCTVAIPEICPRSLILLAEIMKRLESAGISVFRSVITPFCQMKPWDQLLPESTLFPTTWPRLLMPVAKAATSTSRQKAEEDCECAVRLAKERLREGCAINAADFPNRLAPVVNGEGEIRNVHVRCPEARRQCGFSTLTAWIAVVQLPE